uniref:Uncharacterized protein n=1 Tax=Candidatus Kentrum sp. LFY TaxID=2126342 RepID=A0A450X486_9GAMM|nr:MAG: hypothetical protein BECKLFY1418C_GA0070996_11665 [Candidatus Kentron sp. LFY]
MTHAEMETEMESKMESSKPSIEEPFETGDTLGPAMESIEAMAVWNTSTKNGK